MAKRFRLWPFKIKVYYGADRMTLVDGVNSIVPGDYGENADGSKKRHILMLDFDDVRLPDLIEELAGLQIVNGLPKIYVFNTGRPDSYHAYCFVSLGWQRAFYLAWGTMYVDPVFLKMAFTREYFTLRFSDKNKRQIELCTILESPVPEDVKPEEMGSFVRYLTKRGKE